MGISKTYRFLAGIISAALFFGAGAPVLLQASMYAHCETMVEVSEAMQSPMHDHDSMSHSSMEMNSDMGMSAHEDCCDTGEMMSHHQTNKASSESTHCEITIDCNCDLSEQTGHKEALLLQQVKLPDLAVSIIETDLFEDHSDPSPIPIYYSNSYSPPLLFLANESLLI